MELAEAGNRPNISKSERRFRYKDRQKPLSTNYFSLTTINYRSSAFLITFFYVLFVKRAIFQVNKNITNLTSY